MTTYDAIIIGSGAGGGPVAHRLAKAGANVVVIERGKRHQASDFDRDEIEWCRRNRFIPSVVTDPHTRRTTEKKRANPTTDGWISTVVGGGTVHMGAFFLRAHPDDFKQKTRLLDDAEAKAQPHTAADWPFAYKELVPFYDEVERVVGVSPSAASNNPPLMAHPVSTKIDAAAKAIGVDAVHTPRGISSVARPDEGRKPCAHRPLCASYGCPNDAKGSTLVSYLRAGEKTGNLKVMAETRCTKILVENGRAVGVDIVERGAKKTLKAKVVVVACGAIESARLMLLSGVGNDQVGKNLWFSLFTETSAFFAKTAFPEVMGGVPFVNRTLAPSGMVSSSWQEKLGVRRAGTLQLSWVHDNPIFRAERVATERGKLLYGSDLKRALEHQFLDGRAMRAEGFGETVPHAGAYVDLDNRKKDALRQPVARITWKQHKSNAKTAKAMKQLAETFFKEMGASDVQTPFWQSQTWVLQGGTCRMAKTAAEGVVDERGEVFGVKGLFVSDGAAMPSSLAVPTTLTLMANAARVSTFVQEALSTSN